MRLRPNYDEQIPSVFEGLDLKNKLPERSAVFLRNSPQMSKFYDETITDLQKSSQDQMTEEMKQNMIRQMAGQTGRPATPAASEAGSELLRRLRPVWLDSATATDPQFFDMFGNDGDDDFMSTVGDIPDIQPTVPLQIQDGLLGLPSSSSASSAGLSAHEIAQAMAQIRKIELEDAAAIAVPMDTGNTAVVPGKRSGRPQTIFEQRSPEKKASRTALDDIYIGLAVPEGRPETTTPMLALEDAPRTQLIDLLTRELMKKPKLDLSAVIQLQIMSTEDLKKEASLAFPALPPLPEEVEEEKPRKVKKRQEEPFKKRHIEGEEPKAKPRKKEGSIEKAKKSTRIEHGLQWFKSGSAEPTPMPHWRWKKELKHPVQTKEHAEMAGVRWTPDDLEHFKKKTMTKQMIIERVRNLGTGLVLP